MIALDAAIAGTIAQFYSINKTASYLLVPYLAWVSFASAITYSIWRRNRDLLDVVVEKVEKVEEKIE